MLETVGWDAGLATGELVDYTEVAGLVGIRWPLAVTEELEAAVQKTLPDFVAAPATLDEQRLKTLEVVLGNAVRSLVEQMGAAVLRAGENESERGKSVLEFEAPAAWKDGLTFKLRVEIGPGPEGKPAFVLGLAE